MNFKRKAPRVAFLDFSMKTNRIFRRFAGLLLAGGLFLTNLDATAQTGTGARRDVLREITDVRPGLRPPQTADYTADSAARYNDGSRVLHFTGRAQLEARL